MSSTVSNPASTDSHSSGYLTQSDNVDESDGHSGDQDEYMGFQAPHRVLNDPHDELDGESEANPDSFNTYPSESGVPHPGDPSLSIDAIDGYVQSDSCRLVWEECLFRNQAFKMYPGDWIDGIPPIV